MATQTITGDVRRTDIRANVLENPYWITSADLTQVKGQIILFSFPTAGQIYIVESVVLEVVTAYTAGTTINIGAHTLATDAVTTAGDLTTVDDDEYIKAADITATTGGIYAPTTGNTSDWLTNRAAFTWAAPLFITGAATTVPIVTALIANAGAISAGAARLHMLITKVPQVSV